MCSSQCSEVDGLRILCHVSTDSNANILGRPAEVCSHSRHRLDNSRLPQPTTTTMTHFLAYLIAVNLVAFLVLSVTHRPTRTPDGRRTARNRNIRGNSRQPADSPAARVLSILMPLLALAGGSVGMLLGLILWERNVNKHNVAWWFETAVGLVAWGMVCAWRCGLVSFNGAGMFRAFNPVMLRGFGIYLLAMNCVTLLVFVADKRIALANGDTPRSRGRGAGSDRSGGGARSRVPESWLMGLSFMGGALGGIIAMRLFNHKTRDWYFVWGLPVFVVLQSVLFLYLHAGGLF